MLTPLQERIARIAATVDRNGKLALAGGAALILRGLVDRRTRDVDLFAVSERDIDEIAPELERALEADGLAVGRVREGPGFVRFEVRWRRDSCIVDLGVDARMLPPEPSPIIQTVAADELAADKVLALFDRAEARDFVDVYALAERHGRRRLLQLAAEKDPGFDRHVFATMLTAINRLQAKEFDADAAAVRRIRQFALDWAAELGG